MSYHDHRHSIDRQLSHHVEYFAAMVKAVEDRFGSIDIVVNNSARRL
jgi:hypothetical protein